MVLDNFTAGIKTMQKSGMKWYLAYFYPTIHAPVGVNLFWYVGGVYKHLWDLNDFRLEGSRSKRIVVVKANYRPKQE